MKNIKNFEHFLNEELKTDTYRRAANKLKSMGHTNRSSRLSGYADDKVKNITPVTINLRGQKFVLDHENIQLEGEGTKNIEINILFDKEKYNKSEKERWENLTKKEQEELKTMFDFDEDMFDFDSDYSDLSTLQREIFTEFLDIELPMLFIEISRKTKRVTPGVIRWEEPEVSGILLDRPSANKVFKLLKEYGEAKGGEVKQALNQLKVNHLYAD